MSDLAPEAKDGFEVPFDIKAAFYDALKHVAYAHPDEIAQNPAFRDLTRENISDKQIAQKTGLPVETVSAFRGAISEINQAVLASSLPAAVTARDNVTALQQAFVRRYNEEFGM